MQYKFLVSAVTCCTGNMPNSEEVFLCNKKQPLKTILGIEQSIVLNFQWKRNREGYWLKGCFLGLRINKTLVATMAPPVQQPHSIAVSCPLFRLKKEKQPTKNNFNLRGGETKLLVLLDNGFLMVVKQNHGQHPIFLYVSI